MSDKEILIIYNDDGVEEHPFHDGKNRIAHEGVAKTAAEVKAALKENGFSVEVQPLSVKMGIDALLREVKKDAGRMVFNLCEAAFGQSALEMNVAALLELYGVKFTGSPALTLGLALDKGLSKDILNSRNIPTPAYCVLTKPPSSLKKGLSLPLIVKPLREDASIGIDSGAVVRTMDEFKKRVEFVVNHFAQPAIVEEYIEGREFNVAVIGNGVQRRALPPAELTFVEFPVGVPKICSYEAKWDELSPLYKKTVPVCPADLPAAQADEMASIAISAYDAMGCRDYARIDMRVGLDGRAKVLEVNPNPDISSNAGLARAAKAAGFNYQSFIAEVVSMAWARYDSTPLSSLAAKAAGGKR